MSPYEESGIASARRQIARCEALLRKAAIASRPEEWQLIGQALGAAVTAGVMLDGVIAIGEMAAGAEVGE